MTLLPPDDLPERQPRKKKDKPVFKRLNSHAKRAFRMISKKKLMIPTDEYQRDESEGKIAREIAMNYDEVAFGALTVIQYPDGSLHVADGGTRLSAALLRDDIDQVPCMLYVGLTHVEAADTFMRINMNRRRLNTVQQQQAGEFAGHSLETRVREVLDGFESNSIGFDSLNTLRACTKTAPEATRNVSKMAWEFAHDKFMTARVFKGLVGLEVKLNKKGHTLDTRPNRKKLLDKFGFFDAAIQGAIPQRSSGDRDTCATAIAKIMSLLKYVKGGE